MNGEYFQIAYALAKENLCLFTGTGFSRALSRDCAPSWQGLLERCCDILDRGQDLKAELFANSTPFANLHEAAQIIDLQLRAVDKNIHEEIARIIEGVELSNELAGIDDFFNTYKVQVVTTNYDKLLEKLVTDFELHSIAPGLPIPKSNARLKIYHVHGSIDSPKHMVITSDDYFRFMNNQSYFSKKLSTIFHEMTVVILGYSLGDTNLNAIINEYKSHASEHLTGSSIYLVTREDVLQSVKDHYAQCYGIQVINSTEIEDFLKKVGEAYPKAKQSADRSTINLTKVLDEGAVLEPKLVLVEDSFYAILSALNALGRRVDEPKVLALLEGFLSDKVVATRQQGAWDQYPHLAGWLIYLAKTLEIPDSLKNLFLEKVTYSMSAMRRPYFIGGSWAAYNLWKSNWLSLLPANRNLIRSHVRKELSGFGDAIGLVAPD